MTVDDSPGGGTREAREARLTLVEEHVRHENRHDLDAVMATFGATPEYEDTPWRGHHTGRDGVRAYYEGLLRAVPDLHIDVQRRHVTDEHVVLEVVISGTHTGPWRGLPGTGRRVEFPLCAVYSFDEEDKLAGERIYYDRATVLRQLGVFHEPDRGLGRLLTPLAHPLTIARAVWRTVRD
ncbi:ester cyclase [Halegenticoccus soli]|uniref:ester cyclase n=1 Tax=Halegenticoccus soli TaxID=1985678 RepID=UPI000C6E1E86|nr:ester cyclase [Halegenticoccus soli]